MRKLIGVVIVAGLVWAGYWFVAARTVKSGLTQWLGAQQAAGLQVSYTDLAVAGFPNRLDSTLHDLRITDPANGIGWQAPFVQILALSYRPNRVIVVFPHDQIIDTGLGQIAIASTDMRASATFRPAPSLPLDHSALVAQGLRLTGAPGHSLSADDLRFATRAVVGLTDTHRIGLAASGLTLSQDLWNQMLPGTPLPAGTGQINLDADLALDAPLDRFALSTPPNLTAIDLKSLVLQWGDIRLNASGTLTASGIGLAEGTVMLRAENWRQVIPLAVTAGLLDASAAPRVEQALSLLAGLDGDKATLDLPLTFRNGLTSLGPVPLGAAPRLRRY